MRITGHELYRYRLPYRRPVTWFRSIEDSGDFVALRLFGEDGARGVAEAAVKATWSGLSMRALAAVVEDVLLPSLAGTDISDLQSMRRTLSMFPDNQLAKMLVINACAVLSANADARRGAGAPDAARSVEVSWCVTRQPPSAMAEDAGSMIDRHGFRTLKIKGGQGFDTDRAALRAVRSTVGQDVSLTVDANGAYTLDQAGEYVEMLADEGVMLAEDPAPFLPDAAFAAFVASSRLPILVDSPCVTAADAAAFIGAGATALSIKPGRVGVAEAAAVETLARAAGVGVCAGMYAESALGSLTSLHFAESLPRPVAPAEQTFFLSMTDQVMTVPLIVEDGRVSLPDLAELDGLIDWRRLERLTF